MGRNGGFTGLGHNIWGVIMDNGHKNLFGGTKWDKLKERVAEADRVRASRKAAEAGRADRELTAAATPQTMRKLRRDVVQTWHGEGKLGAEQVRAAEEIQRVYQAVTSALFPRTGTLEPRVRGADVSADWPPALQRAWRERYKPWANETGKISVRPVLARGDMVDGNGQLLAQPPARGDVTVQELVLGVVVENLGADQLRRHYQMDRARAVTLVQDGLYRYAALAGWVDEHKAGAVGVALVDARRQQLVERLAARSA